MIEKIAAGIIIYNPNIDKLNNMTEALAKKVDKIYLVDNASKNREEIDRFYDKAKSDNNLFLIRNKKNKGVAAALNQYMGEAQKEGYEWVLCFDQDSVPPDGIADEFIKFINKKNAGIIAPRIKDARTGRFIYSEGEDKSKEADEYQYIDKCITSGSLVNVEVWAKVGKYDEYLFIDYVDFDFCIRIKKKGYEIIQANRIVMEHELGNMKIRRFLFKKVAVMNHNAMRKYYMTRNRIYCNFKYNNRFGFRNFVGMIKMIILIIFFEEEKRKKIRAVIKGAYDGVRDAKKMRRIYE